MKIWLITGAQAGVGKSTLMNELADVLPNSESLKLGHGLRKASGVKNFFTDIEEALDFIRALDGKCDHCLIESNRLVGRIKSDLIIFLDTIDGDRRHDAERLQAAANIIVGGKQTEDNWRKSIERFKFDEATTDGIIEALKSQNEYLTGSRIILRTKLWFSKDGRMVFGEGLSRLLRGIETHGSLSAAAKDESISYRHAWGDIRRAEERLGFALITSTPGGAEGGGSRLTDKGKLLLKGFEDLRRKVIKDSDKYFKVLLAEIEASD